MSRVFPAVLVLSAALATAAGAQEPPVRVIVMAPAARATVEPHVADRTGFRVVVVKGLVTDPKADAVAVLLMTAGGDRIGAGSATVRPGCPFEAVLNVGRKFDKPVEAELRVIPTANRAPLFSLTRTVTYDDSGRDRTARNNDLVSLAGHGESFHRPASAR
jgi:hypothetical protein